MIRDVVFPADTKALRALIYEYVDWLGIDLSYQNFADEMAALERLFSLPSGQYTFAMENAEVAGGVGFRRIDPFTAEVKRLYVRPRFQGKGLGLALMENLLARLRELGYRRAVLDAVPPTKNAQLLYEAMGFYEIPPYFANPTPDTRFYAFDLHADAGWVPDRTAAMKRDPLC
jgi:ribosomal protein S18 acetylase RimI-like enzyme